MAAQSISFFFRHVLKRPYAIPSVIYPRRASTLPPVMSPQEVKALIDTSKNIKHRAVVILLYSTGMRLSEVSALKITDIDSKNMRIKIVHGKGAKDRFTILSEQVLRELRTYYLSCRPKEYLFNGYKKGKPISPRMIQHIVQSALTRAGLGEKHYTVHTLRHSFATHLVDQGTDLHTVKELLGHSSLTTTMRYMHLTSRRVQGIVNPFDRLVQDDAHKTSIKSSSKKKRVTQ